jgi:ubiquinone/menaquinone biosynthesis C-methylase UbiE
MLSAFQNHIDVARAFDSIAGTYDASFESSVVTQKLRQRIYAIIEGLVQPPSRILDLSCGTGTDARSLAEKGYVVVGVDISNKMIAEARNKVNGRSNLQFLVSSYHDLAHLAESGFDLVLSNFGGLNCTNDLKTVGSEVVSKLKPNGYFIAVVMPPFSLWESVSFVAGGRFKEALRRIHAHGAETRLNGQTLRVHYHSPGRIAQELADGFALTRVIGLNIFSPPSHAKRFIARFPELTSWLETIDFLFCRLPLLRSMGDHCLVVLRKRTV